MSPRRTFSRISKSAFTFGSVNVYSVRCFTKLTASSAFVLGLLIVPFTSNWRSSATIFRFPVAGSISSSRAAFTSRLVTTHNDLLSGV